MKKKCKHIYFLIAFILGFCMFSEVITYGADNVKKVTIKKLKVEYNGEKAKEVPGCVIDGKAYVKLVEICDVTDRALAYDKQAKKYNYIIVPKDFNWSSASETLGYVEISRNKNSECSKTFDKIKIEKLAIDNGFSQNTDAFFINGQPYVKLADYACFKGRKMELKYDSKGKKYVLTYKDEDIITKPTASAEPTTKPTPEPTTEPKQTNEMTLEEQVVELVNKERAKKGVAALKIDPIVAEAAAIRAKEIRTCYSHTRPDGTGFRDLLMELGFSKGKAFDSGENLVGGFKTPKEVMSSWMGSPGHKTNILDPDFTSIGVGYYHGDDGYDYWVQIFIVGD